MRPNTQRKKRVFKKYKKVSYYWDYFHPPINELYFYNSQSKRTRGTLRQVTLHLCHVYKPPVQVYSVRNMLERTHDYSFACGGWLKLYLFGVAKYLQQEKLIDKKNSKFIGCSAGALAATGLALDVDFEALRDSILNDMILRAHENVFGAFKVRDYLKEAVEVYGNLHEYEKLNETQNLVISYSSLSSWKARRVSQFESKEDLLQALIASCCATPIAGFPFQYKNELIFDGGLTDFQPVFDEKTITVSPFYCTSEDIRPSRYVPIWWALYPPGKEQLEWLFDLGYDDAQVWASRQGYTQKKPMRTRDEKYDHQWRTSLGRFTGYQILENQVLDVIFVVFVQCLWKPLAFTLVYAELALKAILFAATAIVFGIACKLMLTLSISGIVASLTPMLTTAHLPIIAGISLTCTGLIILVLWSGGMQHASEKALKHWKTSSACLRNIGSLSLFLRTVPLVGRAVRIKRHEFLMQHSFIYRLTNHFV